MFFVYSLKVALCLMAFYLIYKVMLVRDTFFRFNRFVVLSLMSVSLLLPLVELHPHQANTLSGGFVYVEGLMSSVAVDDENGHGGLSAVQVVFTIYIIGVAFFLVRELFSVSCLLRLIRKGDDASLEGDKKVVLVDKDISPFSWFGNIIMSRSDYAENRREILMHEQAHIERHHSADILFCDLLIIFQWFNPAAWLMKRELQAIHEYQADEAVLAGGVDARQYQMLLIRKAVGDRFYAMANNLNHSTLKKRIEMMLKRKSNPMGRAKILAAVPMAALAVVAFASPEAENISGEITAEGNSLVAKVEAMPEKAVPSIATDGEMDASEALADTLRIGKVADRKDAAVIGAVSDFSELDTKPEFQGGVQGLMRYLSQNIRYPEKAIKENRQGRVIVKFLIDKDGSVTDAKVVNSCGADLDAEALRVVGEMPKWTPGKKNGKVVKTEFTLPVKFSMQGEAPRPAEEKTVKQMMTTTKVSVNGTDLSKFYFVVDGKHVLDISDIKPSDIESVEVLNVEQAVKRFGSAAKNGAMVVKTKK